MPRATGHLTTAKITRKRKSGRPGWDRTSNPQLRRLMLYPIELRAHDHPCVLVKALSQNRRGIAEYAVIIESTKPKGN